MPRPSGAWLIQLNPRFGMHGARDAHCSSAPIAGIAGARVRRPATIASWTSPELLGVADCSLDRARGSKGMEIFLSFERSPPLRCGTGVRSPLSVVRPSRSNSRSATLRTLIAQGLPFIGKRSFLAKPTVNQSYFCNECPYPNGVLCQCQLLST